MARARPKLAVWKFASCDGCQLTLLDCEDELLEIAEQIEIAYFLEASRATVAGPYDLSFVEGSITTPEDARRIQEIRASSSLVVALGACATAGGIQALRDFGDVEAFARAVYPRPELLSTLPTSAPISEHVFVDFELRGCPISKAQLVEVVTALLHERAPVTPRHSVCVECKARGTPCVMVAAGTPCLGPITQAGCGAICPAWHRGCYGCFGPMESAHPGPLTDRWRDHLGVSETGVRYALRTFNAGAAAFRTEGDRHG